ECRKIGDAALQPVERRRVAVERQGSIDPVVPVEHASKSCFWFHQAATGLRTRRRRSPFCLMGGEWGKNWPTAASKSRKPIDPARLDELALAYVSRFATS